ncbi:fatty acid oxidation complex subunit alpha FadB [bacterium]|nr:fatty acid oxidation complex subunit alpha FadB [bacterium]
MIYQGKAITVSMLANGIAELCFNVPDKPVNTIGHLVVSELEAAVKALSSDSSVKGLIYTSAKDDFISGADITEFNEMFAGGRESLIAGLQNAHKTLNALEDLPFPKVAAINGFALGGGYEVALSAEYRVLADSAKIGFPEVKLGIIPGYGGTVRLLRLIGADNAIEWICSGKHVRASAALKNGGVDAVVPVDKVKDVAIAMAQSAIAGDLDYNARREEKKTPVLLNDMERMMAFMTAKGVVAAQAGRNYPAPVRALKTMEAHSVMNRDDAINVEIEAFVDLAYTEVSRSLIGLFLNDQYVNRIARKHISNAKKVERAAVLGAGIMGGGIAYQSASKNIPIMMKDINQAGLDLGLSEAAKLLDKLVSRGRMSSIEMATTLNRIDSTLSYDGINEADIVVEAVVENPNVKKKVLPECESNMAEDAILCSNTSTISITELATSLKRPENFCGMHFFNPVHKMPLVEVIRGEKSSEEAISRTVAYAKALGKTPIVVKDCGGFLVNRVLFPYFFGFNLLLKDGADFLHIDKVMEKFGWPMGPAYLLDVVGFDTSVHGCEMMAQYYPDRMTPGFKTGFQRLYEDGRLGQKNDTGYYKYSLDKKGRPKKEVDPTTKDLLAEVVGPAKEFSDEEIIDRMMIPMALELVRCLDEGIVETPAEADMALVMGIGFPPFRGGVCRYIDSMGVQAFCDRVEKYSDLAPAYELLDSLKAMAKDGKTFY